MRIKNSPTLINYDETKKFFDNRVKKYNDVSPYSVTMYQDNNPGLVESRNYEETNTLIPLLSLDKSSKLLDVACGIGRWSDAIAEEIESYCGVDFCEGLIEIAKKRNQFPNRAYYVGKSTELTQVFPDAKFNVVLLIGFLQYINDDDTILTLKEVEKLCHDHSIICIKTSIGINERLTLKSQFSEELLDNYNAIYRTREELLDIFSVLFSKGFKVIKESFMFNSAELNNRKETAQYYFILERQK